MLGSRAFFALMRRNLVYRKRNWVGSLLEIGLPVFFVALLLIIKNNVGDEERTIVPPNFPSNEDAYTPLSFADYVTALQAERLCVGNEEMTGLPNTPRAVQYDWQVPFVRCDVTRCTAPEDGGAGTSAQQFCEYQILAVAPSSDTDSGGLVRTDRFINYLYREYPAIASAAVLASNNRTSNLPFSFPFVQKFNSSSELNSYIKSNNYGKTGFPKVAFAVVWDGNTPTSYKYDLRQNQTIYNVPSEDARPASLTTPPTTTLVDSFAVNDDSCPIFDGAPILGPREGSCTGQYLYNGMITMHTLVGEFILDDSGASTSLIFRMARAAVRFVPFPTRQYEEGGFFDSISDFVGLLCGLGLLYPVAAMVIYVTQEKELRQKELMKMMSVTESDIGWSWFMTFFSWHMITIILTTVVSGALYENSEGLYLFIFWLFTFLSLVTFSQSLATFTAKSTRGVIFGILAVLVGIFLTLLISFDDGSDGLINLLCLHPVAAFGFGLQVIGQLEDAGIGLQSSTVGETDNNSGLTFNLIITYLIRDTIIWGVLSAYLNRVIKPDYGQALPFYYPFTRAYWCPSGSNGMDPFAIDETTGNELDIPTEPVGEDLRRQAAEGESIEIRHLSKVFGEKIAVDDLSLSIYRGEITALLGHNGAGKTTTISMLTGALAPTGGSARICGKDMSTQMSEIRKDIGICLQHDCLFPRLTVREHVQFFSRLKGLYKEMPYEEAENHIDQVIKDVALYEKRNTFSKNLSGGMKRKLSVAMAFCGGSKVVLLDEPTSGMDPFSRRFTWNVIRQYRQKCCIILTTHFMDEADVLGDRIAIMGEGRLRCVGSPMFLKKRYGVGYQLTIEKQHKAAAHGASVHGSSHGSAVKTEVEVEEAESLDDKLRDIVKGNVPEASMLNNVGTEMTFQLPLGAASQFAPMFEGLDEQMELGTVSTYGVGITTLEEVFLLVARGVEDPEKKKSYRSSRIIDAKDIAGISAENGTDEASKSVRSRMDLDKDNLVFRHVGALFRKRAANFRRDKKAWCCTTIFPSVCVLFGFLGFKFIPSERAMQNLELTLDDYNKGIDTPPRNPLVFNAPEAPYVCQPGICAYTFGNVSFSDSNFAAPSEEYFFCGTEASISSNLLCSIADSTSIMANVDGEDGVVSIPTLVTNVVNSSQSLYDSWQSFAATQYGAIYFTHETDSTILDDGSSYSDTVVSTCQGNVANASYTTPNDCAQYSGVGYLIAYNFTALHISPTLQAVATEALARQALGSDDFEVECTIAPLPLTSREAAISRSDDAFIAWFLVVLSFPFIAGAFATFVVQERESKAKHLQTVAGVEPWAYWLSTYLWDILNYLIPMGITIILMFAFDVSVLTTTDRDIFGGILLTLFLYGPASAGFTYCLSFAFTNASLCNVVVIISGFLVGLGGPITIFILEIIGNDVGNPNPKLTDIADLISWILRLHPMFCLGRAIFFAINIETVDVFYAGTDSAWDGKVLLYDVIFLGWESVVYIAVAVQIDKWSSNPRAVATWNKFLSIITCGCLCPKKNEVDITVALPEDSDVIEEQDRVLGGGANNDLIVVSELTKVYGNGKKAVNNLSLGIAPGECFGLLGINGAGKTTTMQMLTAEFPPTSGDATLAGYSVSKEPQKTRRRVGYCPQFDAHFPNLSGREHVELYASVKGVPRDLMKEAVASKLREVGLNDFDSDRLTSQYSGGMRRRLSLACATIGQPQIVFLDECSTGVDPVARREIWQLVSDMVSATNIPYEERTSVVLTTHSMEECEALCPRIGIMANGRLRCLGSAQHLKDKFGQGFQIELKCASVGKEDADYLQNAFALAQFKGNTEGVTEDLFFNLFFNLEEAQAALNVLAPDGSLSQTVNPFDPTGYNVHKNATSAVGTSLDELAAFATGELRIKHVQSFVETNYRASVLRERQATKVRYEVGSEGVKISGIFGKIEDNKERLMLEDYGVSQTSLEQVFNHHAEEAEALKQGRNDS